MTDGEFLTTMSPSEHPGGNFEGEDYYLLTTSVPGTSPVYRLFNGYDHMDSRTAGEGGYRTEAVLGYSYNSSGPGLCQMIRYYNPANGHHLTAFCNEHPPGWTLEGGLGYGFYRQGTLCENTDTISGSAVVLRTNVAAGGSISEFTWNGKQFVNDFDYGRQIQSSVFLNNAATSNPTEGGDRYGCPGPTTPPPGWAHGSPLGSLSIQGKTLSTSSMPLEFTPENFGGSSTNPVLWSGTISKKVDLDFAGQAHIIRWTTTVNFPNSEPYEDLEVVSGYLTSDFARLYAYNATSSTLTDLTSTVPNNGCLTSESTMHPPAGGVILATASSSYALGGYMRGENTPFGLCKFLNGSGGGQYGGDTTKFNVRHFGSGSDLTAGPHTYVAYLTFGTLTDVLAAQQYLYSNGY